jgi:putative transposase
VPRRHLAAATIKTGGATPFGGKNTVISSRESWRADCQGPGMAKPRSIHPGTIYMLTRRVILRHMLLRPDAEMNNLLVYALAVSAERFGVRVHAFCAMSTHVHLVVTDERGVLPRFLHAFHRSVALGTKALRKWDGPVWDQESPSVVSLETREVVEEKIAYVIANPVGVGLMKNAAEWPGVNVRAEDLGSGSLHATRPNVYFNPKNRRWPESVRLNLSLPSTVEPEHAEALRRVVDAAVTDVEKAAVADADTDADESSFLSPERIASLSPFQRVVTPEPAFARNPTFAVGRGRGEAWHRAAMATRAFRSAYRSALERWRAGVRDVLFPAGTWWMRVFHAARVSDDPLPAPV